jgi:hypothetical protein
VRGGIGMNGRPLDPTQMPWTVFSRFTDLETAAIYRYLASLATTAAPR